MKKKKYLPLYYKWMETGVIEDDPNSGGCGGLCNTIIDETDLELFKPTDQDLIEYNIDTGFWGSGLSYGDMDKVYSFTPLRQNIVLLLAAMNGEL